MTASRRLGPEPAPWSPGRPANGVKPPNQQRAAPTVSFSLSHAEMERVRQLAYARDVSISQVLREAIALVLAQWGADPAAAVPDAAPDEAPPAPPRLRRSRPAPPPARPRWAPDDGPQDN